MRTLTTAMARSRGLCVRCHHPYQGTRHHCDRCAAYFAAYYRRRYQELLRRGCCVRCGEALGGRRTQCAACALRAKIRRVRRKGGL